MSIEQVSGATAESPRGVAVPLDLQAAAQPITQAGRRIYETIAGSVEWYVEQWEDLVVEARASLVVSDEGLSVAGILADLAHAPVASDAPGRVRLRLKQLKGRDHLAQQSAQALRDREGITQVEVSARTGSVLIHYDVARYPTRDSMVSAMSADK